MKILCYEVPEILDFCICDSSYRSEILDKITAASSRDLTRDMVRTKSSNIWSYRINVKNNRDKTGDMYIQFKGKNGGPDDIYVYYDVPIKIYKHFVSAPSKGHAFWKYIRNVYKYSKLTGDKRGKLKNAIN